MYETLGLPNHVEKLKAEVATVAFLVLVSVLMLSGHPSIKSKIFEINYDGDLVC